ncbi:hypothetical protein EVAR_12728_1 [Eumeta japonica]|uniref:Uncharacterized protein n=1 Tax=Eumeta variegata TaxID=151549 RepID=A0A4C1UNZ3_EUMVA|nr:hypothetical protein EVAR_12728_1 [Eumeta japonica]
MTFAPLAPPLYLLATKTTPTQPTGYKDRCLNASTGAQHYSFGHGAATASDDTSMTIFEVACRKPTVVSMFTTRTWLSEPGQVSIILSRGHEYRGDVGSRISTISSSADARQNNGYRSSHTNEAMHFIKQAEDDIDKLMKQYCASEFSGVQARLPKNNEDHRALEILG